MPPRTIQNAPEQKEIFHDIAPAKRVMLAVLASPVYPERPKPWTSQLAGARCRPTVQAAVRSSKTSSIARAILIDLVEQNAGSVGTSGIAVRFEHATARPRTLRMASR